MAIKIDISSTNDIASKLCKYIFEAADSIIREKRQFNIAVSGGSVVTLLNIPEFKEYPHFGRWNVFLVDERFVPIEDEQSTYGTYYRTFGQNSKFIKDSNFFVPQTEGDPDVAAEAYETKVPERMDMVVLGLGPDGHTASIFPPTGLEELNISKKIKAVYNSPKPPSTRITMTLSYLKKSLNIVFVVTGKNKLEAVKKTLSGCKDLPGSYLTNSYWLLDENFGELLKDQ